ncbi:MAG: glycosyltransferase [Bacteroidota bacterium]
MKPAIVIVTHNRADSLKRILSSLLRAKYSKGTHIPLIISIDGGSENNSEILNIATKYTWKYGEKKVINHRENLGLKSHIISCGDLSKAYDSVIVLEDDCYVSRNFYNYAVQSIAFFNEDKNIASIALYSNRINENVLLPFEPLYDGYDNYFMQVPCSWGQIWTKHQWFLFKSYYEKKPIIDSDDNIPERIKRWSEKSWKKYFYKYLVDEKKFVAYPVVSHSTNFADAGEHLQQASSYFQVGLESLPENYAYKFIALNNSNNKFDAFFEYHHTGLTKLGLLDNVEFDLYGSKRLDLVDKTYLVSSKACKKPVHTYGLELTCLLQNIRDGIAGNFFSYAKKTEFEHSTSLPKKKFNAFAEKMMPLAYTLGTSAGKRWFINKLLPFIRS